MFIELTSLYTNKPLMLNINTIVRFTSYEKEHCTIYTIEDESSFHVKERYEIVKEKILYYDIL